MAAQRPPEPNFLQQILQDPAFMDAVNTIVEQTRQPIEVITPGDLLEDDIPTYEQLSNFLLLAVNGNSGFPAQKVTVGYLRNSQKMIIPLALGINPIPGTVGRAPRQDTLIGRYWNVSSMPYAQLRDIFTHTFDAAQVRAVVDAMNVAPAMALFVGWHDPAYYNIADARDDPAGFSDHVFSAISSALQFNCDIRDMGYLNTHDACVGDSDWKNADTVPLDRIRVKLHRRTISYIAALNLPAVGNEPLAAFVRSYGLAFGILPNTASVATKEYKFFAKMPKFDAIRTTIAFHGAFERPLVTPCAQILAIFGLMHLAKDHTFRTGNAEMMRIGTSYVMALRTEIPSIVLDRVKQNMEQYIETAPRPFGLGQTYWLAKVLGAHGKLVSPLKVRLNVTPPPVQPLMIADATRKEWLGLPAGRAIDTMYTAFYPGIEAERAKVLECPPAYSSLHRLYGIEYQEHVDPSVMANVQSMMPTIYGYVMIAHQGDCGEADGLALTLNLKNVQREQKWLVQLWESVWAKYFNAVDVSGIVEFVQHMQQSAGQSSSAYSGMKTLMVPKG